MYQIGILVTEQKGSYRFNPVNNMKIFLTSMPSTHASEDFVGTTLEGNVKVLTNRWRFCNSVDYTKGHVSRVRRHKPQAFQSRNASYSPQKIRKLALGYHISSVRAADIEVKGRPNTHS
jgi:hypothetical protein